MYYRGCRSSSSSSPTSLPHLLPPLALLANHHHVVFVFLPCGCHRTNTTILTFRRMLMPPKAIPQKFVCSSFARNNSKIPYQKSMCGGAKSNGTKVNHFKGVQQRQSGELEGVEDPLRRRNMYRVDLLRNSHDNRISYCYYL